MEETLERLRVEIIADPARYKRGMEEVKVVTETVNKVVEKAKVKVREVFDNITKTTPSTTKTTKEVEKVVTAVNRAKEATKDPITPKVNNIKEIEKQTEIVDRLQREYDSLLNGMKHDPGVTAIETALRQTEKELDQVNAQMQPYIDTLNQFEGLKDAGISMPQMEDADKQLKDLYPVYDALDTKADSLRRQLDAIKMDPSLAPKAQELNGKLTSARDKLTEMAAAADRTEKELSQMASAPNKTNLNGNLNKIQNQLNKLKNIATTTLRTSSNGMTRLDRTVTSLRRRLFSLISGVFVFEVLRKGAVALKEYMQSAAATNSAYAKSISQIKTNLQVAFAPIYNACLPAINALMERINTASFYVASFVNKLFGATYASGLNAAKGINAATAAAKGYGAVAGKMAPASFHELTNLSGNESSGGSGSAVEELVPTSVDESIVSAFFDKIKEKFKPITDAFEKLKSDGGKLLGIFAETGFKDFYEKFLKPIGEWGLSEEGLPRLINAVNDMIKNIDWDKLNKALADFWDAIEPYAEAVGNGIIDFVTDLTDKIGEDGGKTACDILNSITDALNNGDPEKIRSLTSALLPFAAAFLLISNIFKLPGLANLFSKIPSISGSLPAVVPAIKGIGSALLGVATFNPQFLIAGFAWLEQTFPNTIGKIKSLFDTAQWPNTEGVIGFLGELNTYLSDPFKDGALDNLIEEYKEWISEMWGAISDTFSSGPFPKSKEIFEESEEEFEKGGLNIIKGLIKGIEGGFMLMYEPFLKLFECAARLICAVFGIHSPAAKMKPYGKNIIAGIASGFSSGITDFLKMIPEKMGQVKTSLRTTTVMLANSVITVIESLANGVIKGINKVFGVLNSFNISIPKWVPEFGGNTFSLALKECNLISIPRIKLATGGIVSRATDVTIGEAGREAVLPLDNNTGWMDGLCTRFASIVSVAIYDAVLAAFMQAPTSEGDTIVNIDGEEVFRIIREKSRRFKAATGQPAFA